MKKATIQLEPLVCPSCTQKIEKAVKGLKGVDIDSVKVMFNASKVKLQFDQEQVSIKQVQNSITSLGFEVKKVQVVPFR